MGLDHIARLLRGNRRRAGRQERSQSGYLFAGATPLGPVRLADLSQTGARVELKSAFDPAGANHLLLLATSQLFDAEVVWVRDGQAGLRIGGSRHIRGFVEGELETIKSWWTLHRTESPD